MPHEVMRWNQAATQGQGRTGGSRLVFMCEPVKNTILELMSSSRAAGWMRGAAPGEVMRM
ncbi:MAG: hypothetical protein C4534_05800 [Gaiellales bacterium]|nr:MAG: hypothetical protein C4534_05800 [Gaiellales bacterium]